jgi:hypothetical protein
MNHITFANEYYLTQAQRLTKSASNFGLKTKVYGPEHVISLAQELSWLRNNIRGYGYWVWKPFIILDALSKLEENEVLLYTDASVVMIDDPRRLLITLEKQDIGCFSLYGFKEVDWSKKVAIDSVGVSPNGTDPWQRSATFMVVRKNDKSIGFFQDLLDLCKKKELIDNTMLSNHGTFKSHRNDQSLFSLLSKAQSLEAYRDPSQFGNHVLDEFKNSTYPQIFDLIRDNDLPLIERVKKSVVPKLITLIRKLG